MRGGSTAERHSAQSNGRRGFSHAAFALDIMKLKAKTWVCSSDAEVIMSMAKCSLQMTLAGVTTGEQRILAASIVEQMQGSIPILVANLTKAALSRQRDEAAQKGIHLHDALEAIRGVTKVLDSSEGSQARR